MTALVVMPVAFGQQGASGDVTIRTTPEGAQVTLIGDVIVSGVTPARFRHGLAGEYQLRLKRHGYESYSEKVMLDPTRPIEIDIRMSPKTRFKAMARSLFIPGWGQKYVGQRTKAYVLGALAVGSVAAFLIADKNFDDKYDVFLQKRDEYDSVSTAGTVAELRRLKPGLDRAQEDAYDAENSRRITIGAAIAVWGVNLLDVVLFYPDERATVSVKGLSVRPSAAPGLFGVTLSKGF
ncbi:MAG TPA: PEGA domain-containing protein [Candidatus Deferrimicrobium sp.]|nr:PEGA domain-containing protein [Candidatus Deferrimicrobium sp.]